jgi:hypothetical protein
MLVYSVAYEVIKNSVKVSGITYADTWKAMKKKSVYQSDNLHE